MKIFEDVDIKLPWYLSEESTKKLYAEIQDFPNNLSKMYTNAREDDYALQGDGLRQLPVIHLPNPRIERFPVMVISNTCDIDPANKSAVSPRIMYCPIFKLTTYERYLQSRGVEHEKLQHHLELIRAQQITTKFYLPIGASLAEEFIALLDCVNNCDATELPAEDIASRRIFSLNIYGWYVLLIKLSIHFTRVREGLQREFA